MDTLQKRIRFVLELSKNKPINLAHYIGISESAISQWVNGSTETINSAYLLKVSNFLKEPLIKYKMSLQDLKHVATRHSSKLMAVVLNKNCNNVDACFKPCPTGHSGLIRGSLK